MRLFLTFLFWLSTSYLVAQDTSHYMSKPIKSLEVLQGFEYKQNEITIIVRSGGCTKKSDFRVEHNVVGDFVMISFYRIIADNCRAMPGDESFTYTVDEFTS